MSMKLNDNRQAVAKQDIPQFHTLTKFPAELQKKVTLLQHFRGYMDGTGDGEIGVCNYNSSTNIKSQISPRGGASSRNK